MVDPFSFSYKSEPCRPTANEGMFVYVPFQLSLVNRMVSGIIMCVTNP